MKRSLLKAAEKVSETIKISTTLDINDFNNPRKDTEYFIYHSDKSAFFSLTRSKPALPLTDLDYCKLVRFKNILQNLKNKKPSDYEFFAHKKYRHLVYSYLTKDNSVEILLLQTKDNVVDDFFNKNSQK